MEKGTRYTRTSVETISVRCSGHIHRIRYYKGRLQLLNHPRQDWEAHSLLRRMGGPRHRCFYLLEEWRKDRNYWSPRLERLPPVMQRLLRDVKLRPHYQRAKANKGQQFTVGTGAVRRTLERLLREMFTAELGEGMATGVHTSSTYSSYASTAYFYLPFSGSPTSPRIELWVAGSTFAKIYNMGASVVEGHLIYDGHMPRGRHDRFRALAFVLPETRSPGYQDASKRCIVAKSDGGWRIEKWGWEEESASGGQAPTNGLQGESQVQE